MEKVDAEGCGEAGKDAGGGVSRVTLACSASSHRAGLAALLGGTQEASAYGISGQEILQKTSTSKSSFSPPMA